MKIYGYARVSSKGQNLDRQIEALRSFDDNIIILEDKATGTNTDRPNLKLLLQVIGEGDLVVIKELDRLSRNREQLIEIWNAITKTGADIYVLDMPILDTRKYKDLIGSFVTDLFLSVLGYVAQQETEFRKERQKGGIEMAQKKGVKFGRPNIEFPKNFEEEYNAWKEGKQTAIQTFTNLGLKKSSFYNLVAKYEGRK